MTLLEFLKELHEAASGATCEAGLHSRFEALSKRVDEDVYPYSGICDAISAWARGQKIGSIDISALRVRVMRMMRKWPSFSGELSHPVPSPSGDVGPIDAFVFSTSGEMWLPGEPYADARLDLLRYLIETIERRPADILPA